MEFEYLPDRERIKCYPKNATERRGLISYLNRYKDGYFFDILYKLKIWDGKVLKYNKKDDTIPLGLWKEAIMCCVEFGYKFEILNKNEFPINRDVKKKEFYDFCEEFFSEFKFQPRYYQLEAAWEIIKNRYCNIAVATGGGKTLIYSMVYFFLLHKYPDKRFLLVVPSKTLVAQFYNDINEYNYRNEIDLNAQEIFAEDEKPRYMDPDREPNLVIATFQSLVYEEKIPDERFKPRMKANGKMSKQKMKSIVKSKYPQKWFKQFWSITIDEAHKGKADSYSKKILKYTRLNAYYRWGMSGSYPDRESCEMMQIMEHTGPIVYNIKARQLMDEGFITDVKIRCLHLKHNDYNFQEVLDVVSKRDGKAMYDLEVAKIQEREDRLKIISQVVGECKDNTMVLFHNTAYGERLLEYLSEQHTDKDFHYIDGSVKQKRTKNNVGKNRTDIINKMKEETERVQILIASFGTVATGTSIDTIVNVIFTQSFKKAQIIIQSIGRALRLYKGKKFAYIFDIVDIFNYDEYAERHAKKWKNKLHEHGDKRKKIYEKEEYPYKVIELNLPEIDSSPLDEFEF